MSNQDPTPTPRLPDGVTPDPAEPAAPDSAADRAYAPPAAAEDAKDAEATDGDAADDVAAVEPVPDPETLDRIAEPAVLRHAPRYAAFVRAGALLGIIFGWMIAAAPASAPDENRTAVIAITVLACACLGAVLGAAGAVIADRRSDRSK